MGTTEMTIDQDWLSCMGGESSRRKGITSTMLLVSAERRTCFSVCKLDQVFKL